MFKKIVDNVIGTIIEPVFHLNIITTLRVLHIIHISKKLFIIRA